VLYVFYMQFFIYILYLYITVLARACVRTCVGEGRIYICMEYIFLS